MGRKGGGSTFAKATADERRKGDEKKEKDCLKRSPPGRGEGWVSGKVLITTE